MKRMACLLGVACLLGQTVGTLHPSSHEALPKGGDAALPFVISAAYPFWRASIYPPAAIPFHYVHQIGHHSVWPGEHGTLVVPDGFVMPELIELAHRAGRKVILGVGGANSHSAFVSMAADPTDRAVFVQNLTDFVLDQGYDGVNIDWEFPQTPADRQNLSILMAELRAGLDATDQDLVVSLAVTSNEVRGQWVDVEAITPLLDHYLVMTFGYYGAWGSESGHNAPLYASRAGIGDARSVDRSLRYWAETRGVPRSKIIMGVPSFGIWFDSENLYEPFTDSHKADFQDIKPLIDNGYTRHWDGIAQVPYLTQDSGPGLWSYDDPRSIDAKCDYVFANRLGGVAVWDVTMDRGTGEHELLSMIAHKLMLHRIFLPSLLRGE